MASTVSAGFVALDLKAPRRYSMPKREEESRNTYNEDTVNINYCNSHGDNGISSYESFFEQHYVAPTANVKFHLTNGESARLMSHAINKAAANGVLTNEIKIIDEGSFLSHDSFEDEIGFDKWNRNTLKVLKLTLENQDPELAKKYGLFSQLSTDPVSELNTNPVFDDLIVDSPKVHNRSQQWIPNSDAQQGARFMGFEISNSTVRLLKVAGAIVIAFSVFKLFLSSLHAYRTYQALKIRSITEDLTRNPGTARPDLVVMQI